MYGNLRKYIEPFATVGCTAIFFLALTTLPASLERAGAKKLVDTSHVFDGGQIAAEDRVTLYVTAIDLYKGMFSEPFEICVFIFTNGQIRAFSTHDEDSIRVTVGYLLDTLKEDNLYIKDCVLAVHNHFPSGPFSSRDLQTYGYLKEMGFRGVFGLYMQATGKFVAYEEKTK